jgi:hypothetical protein
MVYFVYVVSSERKTDNKSFFHLVKVLATAIIQILFALQPRDIVSWYTFDPLMIFIFSRGRDHHE